MGNKLLKSEEIRQIKDDLKQFIDENKCNEENKEAYKIKEVKYQLFTDEDKEFEELYQKLLDCNKRLTTSLPRPTDPEVIDIDDILYPPESLDMDPGYKQKFINHLNVGTFNNLVKKFTEKLDNPDGSLNFYKSNFYKSKRQYFNVLKNLIKFTKDTGYVSQDEKQIMEENLLIIGRNLVQGQFKSKKKSKSRKTNKSKSKTNKSIKSKTNKSKSKTVKSIKKRNIR